MKWKKPQHIQVTTFKTSYEMKRPFFVGIRGTGRKHIHCIPDDVATNCRDLSFKSDSNGPGPVELWTNSRWSTKLQGKSISEGYGPHSLPWAVLPTWRGSCYKIRKAAVLQAAVQGIIETQIFWWGHNSPRMLSVCKHQHVKSMTQIPGSQSEKACYLTLKRVPSYEDVKGEGRRRSLCSKRQTYLTHAIKQGL